jgi:hypothetical protein
VRKDPDLIRHEEAIVWTEDISQLDYVRERLDIFATSRKRPVGWRGAGRRVGYSTLKANAPAGDTPGRFARRVFWVAEHDRSEMPNGEYRIGTPAEGVDPRTVTVGVWGELTDRAWGEPRKTKAHRQDGTPSVGGNQSRKAIIVDSGHGRLTVGESMASGSAQVYVSPIDRDRIEIFIDCASGSQLGDGTHVISETLPREAAAELLTNVVKTTPWLQQALAASVIDQWLTHGTAGQNAPRKPQ